jgi:hypothetical protein
LLGSFILQLSHYQTFLMPLLFAQFRDEQYLAFWWKTESDRALAKHHGVILTSIFGAIYSLALLHFILALFMDAGSYPFVHP